MIQGNHDQGNEQEGNDQQGNDDQGNDDQGNDDQGNDQEGNDQQGNNDQGNDQPAIELAQIPDELTLSKANFPNFNVEEKKLCGYDIRNFLQADVSKDNLEFSIADNRFDEFFRAPGNNSALKLSNGQVDYRPQFTMVKLVAYIVMLRCSINRERFKYK